MKTVSWRRASTRFRSQSSPNVWSTRGAPVDGGQLHIKEILIENGCTFVRQGKGDHEMGGFIKSRHWANHTLREAGLPKAF